MNSSMTGPAPNLSQAERNLSLAAGGLLALTALRRGSLLPALLGGYLAYRGYAGHCPLYQALNISTASSPSFAAPSDEERKLDEALEESFPASDPPSWSPGTA